MVFHPQLYGHADTSAPVVRVQNLSPDPKPPVSVCFPPPLPQRICRLQTTAATSCHGWPAVFQWRATSPRCRATRRSPWSSPTPARRCQNPCCPARRRENTQAWERESGEKVVFTCFPSTTQHNTRERRNSNIKTKGGFVSEAGEGKKDGVRVEFEIFPSLRLQVWRVESETQTQYWEIPEESR